MTMFASMRAKSAAVLAGCSLMLTGCLIQPGTFTSELTLMEDDAFTFTYEGEVHFIGLAKLAEESKRSSIGEFQAYCYGDAPAEAVEGASDAAEAAAKAAEAMIEEAEDYAGDRECTPEEVAEQRAQWEEGQQRRAENKKREAEQMSEIFGGIDLSAPGAEAELAALMVRQKGFDRVEAKGEGMFDVSYAISGTLSHDYMFPVIEGFPTNSPFVQVLVRDGGAVRVNAPGFAGQGAANPLLPMMMGGSPFGGGGGSSEELDLPEINGTFAIVTNGDIRANNTDEGPLSEASGQRLTWQINSRTAAAPTALIAFPR